MSRSLPFPYRSCPQHGSRQVCIPGSASFSAPSSVAGRFTVPVPLRSLVRVLHRLSSAAWSIYGRAAGCRSSCIVPSLAPLQGCGFYAYGLRLQHPAASRPPSFNQQLSLPVAQRSCLPNPVCKTLRFCLRRVFCRSYQRLSPLVLQVAPLHLFYRSIGLCPVARLPRLLWLLLHPGLAAFCGFETTGPAGLATCDHPSFRNPME